MKLFGIYMVNVKKILNYKLLIQGIKLFKFILYFTMFINNFGKKN
jgi:hypothetical protein